MLFQILKRLSTRAHAKSYLNNHRSKNFSCRNTRSDRTGAIRIMIFGDSNAYRPANNTKTWPKLLEAKDPGHLNVINESCDGRTTKYDIGERNGLCVIGEKLALHEPLDYIVVLLGTNDVKNKYGPPRPEETAEGINRIMETIKKHDDRVKPILLTPPPLGNVDSGDLAGAQPRIAPVADEYRQLSKKRNVQLIDIFLLLDVNTDLESDMVHLNASGRKKIANAVWAELQDGGYDHLNNE